MSTHANMVKMTTATTGTGTITLGSASSGYQSLASAYGANATVDVMIQDGTAWEVARDCTYTHSGTTLTRGTLEASSTGSALNLSGSATVQVVATADAGRRWDSAGLQWLAASVTTADVTGVVGTMHGLDISGLTATRNFTLPATAAVNDRVGVYITTGDDTYALVLIGDTGDTINGGSAATEWSRLFIAGECVIFRCVTANSAWVVDYDGRIMSYASMWKSAATTIASGSPMKKISVDTIAENFGSLADTSNTRINVRRTGRYRCFGRLSSDNNAITAHQTRVAVNGTAQAIYGFDLVAYMACPVLVWTLTANAGDYIELYAYHSSGSNRVYYGDGSSTDSQRLEVFEEK